MEFNDLFTPRMAAEFLGVSEIAIRKNRHLHGVKLHPRLTLYSRGELVWYQAQGVGRGYHHLPYPDLAADSAAVRAHWLTGVQVAALLGCPVLRVKRNRHLRHVRRVWEGYQNLGVWRRADVDFFATHPPKRGQGVEEYWAQVTP